MFETYRNSIKDLFDWTDLQFDMFSSSWAKHWKQNITATRPALIYSDKQMDHLLALFFVTLNMEEEFRPKIVRAKALFLALTSFYIAEDTRLSFQSEASLEKIGIHLKDLVSASLIKETDKTASEILLASFAIEAPYTYGSDVVAAVDLYALSDLIISSNPIIVLGKACMFYFGDPMKTYFKYHKQDAPLFKPEQFFDATFSNSQSIHDKFLRELYIANLHHLMDVQANKHIFPF